MSRRRRSDSRAHRVRSLLMRWHRRLGIGVALLAIALAVTGVLLNHGHDLALDQRTVTSSTLLRWYGIKVSAPRDGFAVGSHWYSTIDARLFRNDRPLGSCTALLGATTAPDGEAVLCRDRLLLLTAQGELIEEIGNIPDDAALLGTSQHALVMRDRANALRVFDAMNAQWLNATNDTVMRDNIDWAEARPLPRNLRARLRAQSITGDITWERVLLDLHSGRLFGAIGVWIVDLAGLAMIALAASGLWVWLSRRRLQKYRQH